MLKKISFIIVLLVVAECFAGGLVVNRPFIPGDSDGCVSQAIIKFWWEAESTTPEYSAGDTSAAAYSGATLDASAAKSGSYGVYSADGDDYYILDTDIGDIIGSEGRVGMWIKIDSAEVTDNQPRFFQMRLGAGSKPTFELKNANSSLYSKVTWDNSTESDINLVSTDACMTDETWYWFEAWWDDSDDSVGFTVYDTSLAKVDATNCDEDTTGTFELTLAPSQIRIGSSGFAGGSYPAWLDHIIIVNDHEQVLTGCANETSYPY